MDTPDTIDDHLAQFERDVRQLKIEYEQYFGGGRKRPPADIEWRLDSMMKRYTDRGGNMNYAQRFRFGNLVQTYVKYREIFHKRVRKREEGKVDRHFGAAAREVEAIRSSLHPPARKNPVTISCANPAQEPDKVEALYGALRDAMDESGEKTDRPSRAQFEKFLKQKTEQLQREKGSRSVEYVVSVEGGKARLKARTTS